MNATAWREADAPGLAEVRAIRDGVVAPPSMAQLIGFDLVRADPGEVEMSLVPAEQLLNPLRLIHGGVAATLLDTAMGAALKTLLPVGRSAVTHDLKLSYLRPLSLDSGTMRGVARVIQVGRQSAYVQGEVVDGRGRLSVHAVGTFSLIDWPATTSAQRG